MGKGIKEEARAQELEPVSLSELIHQHVRAAIETAVHEELRAALGLPAPILAILDGNAGLRRAVGLVARAAVQRCCVHKLRNLARKAPKHALAEIRDDFHRIVYAANADAARTACAKAAPSSLRSSAFRKRSGRLCAPRTRLNGSTKNFAAA